MHARAFLTVALVLLLPAAQADWDDPNERQTRARAAAESSVAKADAAMAKKPANKEAAAKALKGALVFYAEAARECASPKAEVLRIAERLKALGGMQDAGIKRLASLYDLLDKAKAAKGATSNAGLEQGMAIREIINAILRTSSSGWHDYWRSEKALLWYLNTLLNSTMSDTERARLREMIGELFDYMIENGELTADDKAELMDKADDLARKVKDGHGGMKSVADLRDLKEDFADARRAASEARKAKYREEDRKAEEEERAAQNPPQPMTVASAPQVTSAVQFTNLAGRTEVNRQAVGELQSVFFVALDGTTSTTTSEEIDFTEHKDAISVEFPKVPAIVSIIFAGTAGVIEVLQDGAPSSPVDGIGPRDGLIDYHNTVVRETLTTVGPEGGGLITGPIENYVVTLDGNPTEIIAAQPDQVTIATQGGTPSQTGLSEIVLSDGANVVASATVDSWGYTVSTADVTTTDAWVPIYLQLFGVDPTEMVTVTLKPAEGQIIEPTETMVSGTEAASAAVIAQLRTSTLGPQQFFVNVVREGD